MNVNFPTDPLALHPDTLFSGEMSGLQSFFNFFIGKASNGFYWRKGFCIISILHGDLHHACHEQEEERHAYGDGFSLGKRFLKHSKFTTKTPRNFLVAPSFHVTKAKQTVVTSSSTPFKHSVETGEMERYSRGLSNHQD